MVLCDLILKRFDLTKGLLFKTFVKPLETTQTLDKFQDVNLFLKQREPMPHSLIAFGKARDSAQESVTLLEDPGTRFTRPYWRPPTSRRKDKKAMTDLFRELLALDGREREATIKAQGLRRYGLNGFTRPTNTQPTGLHSRN